MSVERRVIIGSNKHAGQTNKKIQFRSLDKLFSGRECVDCTATGNGLEGLSFVPRGKPDFPVPPTAIFF